MEKTRALELLESFKGKKITVIGDLVLDEYLIGDTGRVSREAPVVVVNYRKSVFHPGGAANAARNISSLGGVATAVGVLGEDEQGRILVDLMEKAGVLTSLIVPVGNARTSLKLRIMAGDLHAQKQQVARVDRLHLTSDCDVDERLLGHCRESVMESDAVLISDYGMGLVPGVLSELAIGVCREHGKPVVVDSRFRLLDFKGATLATPNEVEAMEALNRKLSSDPSVEVIAREIIERAGLDGVIITRGHRGMYVHWGRNTGHSVSIIGSSEATDVTGAGDTVAATAVLTLASGGSMVEAAEMATLSAAVVVMKRGTADASPNEIKEILRDFPSF